MKRYFLLRSNRESGPFTKAELLSCGLLSTDLIWIENESTAWEHPAEIEELKPIAAAGLKQNIQPAVSPPVRPSIPSVQEYKRAVGNDDFVDNDDTELITFHYQSKRSLRRKQKASTNSYAIGGRLFGALVLLIGLALCGFVVVNMLNQFGFRQTTASEAVEIKSEVLPVSVASHTAQAPAQPLSLSQSTLTEEKSTDTIQAKPVLVKKPAKTSAETNKQRLADKPDTVLANSLAKADGSQQPSEPVQKPIEEKTEATPVVSRTPSLQLSVNDYKVGMFGGVSDLELTVNNPSNQKINSAVIEVEFLKPNGSTVKSQTVTAENILPNGSKTIAVPSSNRGVKVRYRVVSAE